MTKTQMKLAGFNFTKINAEKNTDFKGNLEIKANIAISSMEKFKPEYSKQESLKVSFEYLVDYSELGKIDIKGVLFIITDPKTIKDTIKDWKDKNYNADMNIAILNIINRKASIKAFELQEELTLPPHVQLPILRPESKQQKK